MNYYRSTITGKIVSEKALRNLYDIYGKDKGNFVDMVVTKEILEPVENPSLEECLRHGNDGIAILRYRELNENASFEEAKEFVQKIRKEMKQNRNRKKRK